MTEQTIHRLLEDLKRDFCSPHLRAQLLKLFKRIPETYPEWKVGDWVQWTEETSYTSLYPGEPVLFVAQVTRLTAQMLVYEKKCAAYQPHPDERGMFPRARYIHLENAYAGEYLGGRKGKHVVQKIHPPQCVECGAEGPFQHRMGPLEIRFYCEEHRAHWAVAP